MFSPKEIQNLVAEAQAEALAESPQSVMGGPAAALSPETKAKFFAILKAILKVVFTQFTGIPLPAQQPPAPGGGMTPGGTPP